MNTTGDIRKATSAGRAPHPRVKTGNQAPGTRSRELGIGNREPGTENQESEIRNPKSEILLPGFTLVEMLIIVAILILLVGILTPSINRARISAKTNTSKAHIALINTGCEMFNEDFDYYPPSSNASLAGKELIVVYMTGYANDRTTSTDEDNDAKPVSYNGATLKDDDGKDGFGFRTVKRGRVYGPYNGTENIPTDNKIFIDAFGNEILYYRYDTGSNLYVRGHNSTDFDNDGDFDADDQAYLDACEQSLTTFLLLTPGSDKSWGESDDIRNFEAK